MRNNLSKLDSVLSPERLENLRRSGVIIFDVDDTLLARRRFSSERDQIFSESAAAVSVPQLLKIGLTVCVVTGHGWAQLEKRFVSPLTEEIRENREEILKRFFVYANRGAMKIVREYGEYREDVNYGNEFSIDKSDWHRLRVILENLNGFFNTDFTALKEWYLKNFPKFAFDELPPEVTSREKKVLVLRPIPSEAHRENEFTESPRQILFSLGAEALKTAGLDAKYEITQTGKSTLEITKRKVSKKLAFQDLFLQIAKEKDISPETVEESSVFIGDEFAPGGNDHIIPQSFPRALCFSAASAGQENVISLHDLFQLEGIPATSALTAYIIKILTSR